MSGRSGWQLRPLQPAPGLRRSSRLGTDPWSVAGRGRAQPADRSGRGACQAAGLAPWGRGTKPPRPGGCRCAGVAGSLPPLPEGSYSSVFTWRFPV